MKTSGYHKFLFGFTSVLLTIILFSSACKRNKDCDVVINVAQVTTGVVVVGATVHLYPDPALNPTLTMQDQTGTTDASGSVTFTFKLPAILKADVTSPAPFGNGTQLVKLEEGKQVSKTIKVP